MLRSSRLATSTLLTLAVATLPAAAHDFWIEPTPLAAGTAAGGASSDATDDGDTAAVAISFREGHGDGHPLPRNASRLERFEIVGPDGVRRPVPGVDGAHPAGVLRRLAPGLHVVGYLNNPALHRLPAERFERYLEEEGLERIARLRLRRGEKQSEGRERFYRCAKTLVRVIDGADEGASPAASTVGAGGGRPGAARTEVARTTNAKASAGQEGSKPFGAPLSFPLELIPEADPTVPCYAVTDCDRRLAVRLLFRGQPVAGALVKVFARDGEAAEKTGAEEAVPQRLRTDRDGRIEIGLDQAGRWRLAAVHMTEAPPELKATGIDWESWWASLTFEVPPESAQASPAAATAAASRSTARRHRRR